MSDKSLAAIKSRTFGTVWNDVSQRSRQDVVREVSRIACEKRTRMMRFLLIIASSLMR